MRVAMTLAALGLVLAAGTAEAQRRGEGSGRSSGTAPVTKDVGVALEADTLPARDLPVEPRHGLMGSPGSAGDQSGPSRLGPHGERAYRPSYGEAAQQSSGGGEAYETWKSGDRVRSASSADVRSARQQQAPDLEWASPSQPPGTDTRLEPQVPYGTKFEAAQQKPKR